MSAATPPQVRVPVRDGERWRGSRHEATVRPSAPVQNPPDPPAEGGPLTSLVHLVQRVAFWLAVTLPALYLPLVLSPGLFDRAAPGVGVTVSSAGLVAALVALHLFAVVIGHGHARRRS